SAEEISKIARETHATIIKTSNLALSPAAWPQLAKGKILYEQNCISCHGLQGDGNGPLSSTLQPPPTDFLGNVRMKGISPFQAFNTIRLGVPGTTMQGYAQLSDTEVWDLAFFVVGLRHHQNNFETKPHTLSLAQVSSSSDEELIAQGIAPQEIKIARSFEVVHDSSKTLDLAKKLLNESLNEYQKGNFKTSHQKAVQSYLEGVEPVESQLRALKPELINTIEMQMAELRRSILSELPFSEIQKKADSILNSFEKINLALLSPTSKSFYFLMSSSIFLREAFEAVLILILIIGILKRMGQHQSILIVHLGWISAVMIGFLSWYFSGWLLKMNSLQREFLEGAIALLSVIVLIYVGFWLHRNTEIKKWAQYIQNQTYGLTSSGKKFGLFTISFMAVFREAFETVLFLRALTLEGGSSAQSYMAYGVASSFVLILILSYFMLKLSSQLPMKKLFQFSFIMMMILSFIMLGKAIHAFQEMGFLSIHPLPISFQMILLGVHSNWQWLLSQLFLLVVVLLLLKLEKRDHSLSVSDTNPSA
ncbi:MAG: FTR1 family protein, partial [Deltaproteobacteria bacterium]|nr:FTR1 family protein [Deltaproteobacteria bacterium]